MLIVGLVAESILSSSLAPPSPFPPHAVLPDCLHSVLDDVGNKPPIRSRQGDEGGGVGRGGRPRPRRQAAAGFALVSAVVQLMHALPPVFPLVE